MGTLVSTARLPARRSGCLLRLTGAWQSAFGAWRERQRWRALERRLPDLDEATLRDLGIGRSELLSYWAESQQLVEATRLRRLPLFDRWLGL